MTAGATLFVDDSPAFSGKGGITFLKVTSGSVEINLALTEGALAGLLIGGMRHQESRPRGKVVSITGVAS